MAQIDGSEAFLFRGLPFKTNKKMQIMLTVGIEARVVTALQYLWRRNH